MVITWMCASLCLETWPPYPRELSEADMATVVEAWRQGIDATADIATVFSNELEQMTKNPTCKWRYDSRPTKS